MGFKLVKTSDKSCLFCGIVFNRKRYSSGALECVSSYHRRKFCCLSCATSHQHATEPPTTAAARKRAQKYRLEHCEACGSSYQTSVHHLDEEPKNNATDNLQTLCLSCHSFWHAVRNRSSKQLPLRMPQLYL